VTPSASHASGAINHATVVARARRGQRAWRARSPQSQLDASQSDASQSEESQSDASEESQSDEPHESLPSLESHESPEPQPLAVPDDAHEPQPSAALPQPSQLLAGRATVVVAKSAGASFHADVLVPGASVSAASPDGAPQAPNAP
jgi:hypothetical protein